MRHPEQQNGEIFLGNMSEEAFAACGWCSKRKGVVTLDANGDPVEMPGCAPVFIQRVDVRAQIVLEKATKRASGFSSYRVGVFEKMLEEC